MTLEISEDMILLTQMYMVNVLNIVFFNTQLFWVWK